MPETLLIALYLRAVETQRVDGIIRDEKAVEMIQSIDYDFARFDRAWASQVGVAVRTEILDEATTAFIRQYPDASVVNMGAGLCTRFNRVDNGSIIWYECILHATLISGAAVIPRTGRKIKRFQRDCNSGQCQRLCFAL